MEASILSPILLESDNSNDFLVRKWLEDRGLRGGKRVRSFLGYHLTGMLDQDLAIVSQYTEVAEMLHTATLIHDDVIDKAETRRGRASLHQVVDNRKAVLSGDYLLAKCISKLTENENLYALKNISHCLEEIVEGELLQLELFENLYVSDENLRSIAIKKTGALFEWCALIPFYLSGDKKLEEPLRELGQRFGLTFQLIDDVLDFKKETGKPRLQDLKEKRLNFVTLRMIQRDATLLTKWNWDPENTIWTADQETAAINDVKAKARAEILILQKIVRDLRPEASRHQKALLRLISKMENRVQ